MCCTTHDDRDERDQALARQQGTLVAFEMLMAPCEDFRCKCPFGVLCRRQATGEDFRCDWCRDTDHHKWCAEVAESAFASPGLAASVQQGPAYAADFYSQGVIAGFKFAPADFRVPDGDFAAGLAGMRVSAKGLLSPSEVSRLLGLPPL
jgi:hypothetical protein